MLAEVAFRGMVGDFSSRIEDLQSLSPSVLLDRLQDVFLGACRAGKLQAEEVLNMTCVVFATMDASGDSKIECREFMEACTNDGEISMQKMAQFFHRDESVRSWRKFLDDTHLVTSKAVRAANSRWSETVEADSRGAMESITENSVEYSSADVTLKSFAKEQTRQLKPPKDTADHRLECSLANLERRLQEQEKHCELALGLLRDALDQQLLTPRRHTRGECPKLSPLRQLFSPASASTSIGGVSSSDQGTLAQQYTLSTEARAVLSKQRTVAQQRSPE